MGKGGRAGWGGWEGWGKGRKLYMNNNKKPELNTLHLFFFTFYNSYTEIYIIKHRKFKELTKHHIHMLKKFLSILSLLRIVNHKRI